MPKLREVFSPVQVTRGELAALTKAWIARRGRSPIPQMTKKSVSWLIQVARSPGILRYRALGFANEFSIERVFADFPDEAGALWIWARTKRPGQRAGSNLKATALAYRTMMPGAKADAVIAALARAHPDEREKWENAVKDADKAWRVFGKSGRKSTD